MRGSQSDRYAVPAVSVTWRTFDRNRASTLVDRCMACFPGMHDGNLAQGFAATLFEMVKTCDWVIDIHTPARGVFVRSTTLSTVSRGERAATLGLL